MDSIFKLNWTALIAMQRPVLEWWAISLDNFLLEIIGIKFKWFYLLSQGATNVLKCQKKTLPGLQAIFALCRGYTDFTDVIRSSSHLAIVSDAKLNYRQPGMKKKKNHGWRVNLLSESFCLCSDELPCPPPPPCSTSVLFQKTLFSIFYTFIWLMSQVSPKWMLKYDEFSSYLKVSS